MTYDASNPDDVRRAKEEESDRERDLAWIMSKPRGRRWLYTMIFDRCHARNISHVAGDAMSTAFNEGARAIGVSLEQDMMDTDIKLYMTMLLENRGE